MPGNSLGITLPTVSVTIGPTYATNINSALNTIIADIEAKITPDEIDINDDLDFNSSGTSYLGVNIKGLNFQSQSSVLPGGNTNTAYVKDGEFYYQDGSGNDVQLTSGGSVNNAGAGSINTTGSPAYGSGPEVLWSGGDLEYRFKSGAGATDFADLVFADLEFRSGTFTMTMSCAVTTDYSVLWPVIAAVSNNSLLEISTAGQVAFTKAPSVTSLTTSGDITLGGDLIHPSYDSYLYATAFQFSSGGAWTGASGASSAAYIAVSSGSLTVIEIPVSGFNVRVGDTLEQLYLTWRADSAVTTHDIRLLHISTTGTVTEEATTTISPSLANTIETTTWNFSDEVMTTGYYVFRVEIDSAVSARIYGAGVRYKRD